jgi:hypothetical protein
MRGFCEYLFDVTNCGISHKNGCCEVLLLLPDFFYPINMNFSRKVSWMLVSCWVFWGFVAGQAQTQSYQLHSVFMYSFTRYVQWPDDRNTGDFKILVVGESPIVSELQKMAETKKVGSRAIVVQEAAKVTGNETNHIIFISAAKSALLAEVLAKVGSGVLVVTEKEGLGSKGSAINFVMKDGKLAFELNQNALNKQGLKASTELIRLAVVI